MAALREAQDGGLNGVRLFGVFSHESMNIQPNLFDGTQSLGKIVYLYSDFFHLLVECG